LVPFTCCSLREREKKKGRGRGRRGTTLIPPSTESRADRRGGGGRKKRGKPGEKGSSPPFCSGTSLEDAGEEKGNGEKRGKKKGEFPIFVSVCAVEEGKKKQGEKRGFVEKKKERGRVDVFCHFPFCPLRGREKGGKKAN